MDPKKLAAMKAAMQNIKDGLRSDPGMADEDFLSSLEKKMDKPEKAKPDAGLSPEDIAELMEGINRDGGSSVEVEMGKPEIISRKSKDGGVEVEIKKPVELKRKPDGGVMVEQGEIKIEKRVPNPKLEEMKRGLDNALDALKPDIKKMQERLDKFKDKPLLPEAGELKKKMEDMNRKPDAGASLGDLSDEEKLAVTALLKQLRSKG